MKAIKIAILGTAALGLSAVAASGQSTSTAGVDLPPNARPGECYARVVRPAKYEDVSERVLIREASKKVAIQPAVYNNVEETVIVEEASTRLEIIPAKYAMKTEEVVIKPASEKLVTVPARYETVEEKVLVKPAHTVWKKGTGPIQKVADGTGEIMCLVEIPAEYKTVKKRVIASPASTQRVMIPAVTRTMKKKVMVTGPTTRTVTIPAKYDTVKVQKMVSPAREIVTEIPAEYATVTKSKKVSEGVVAWQSILCETNTTVDTVRQVQIALQRAGYTPGKIDGVIGGDTRNAIDRFQRAKGLSTGQLTMETLKVLGVAL